MPANIPRNQISARAPVRAWIAPLLLAMAAAGTAACARPLPSQQVAGRDSVYWIDTDLGFDVDDFMALLVANARAPRRIVGASTTMYGPRHKARLVRVIFDAIGLHRVPVYAGLGSPFGDDAAFFRRYPRWPPQFGGPYARQGEALRATFGSARVEGARVRDDAVQALLDASRRYAGRLELIVLGPMTNIAAAIRRDPELPGRLRRLVAMGGWYARADGSVERPSYNQLMDLEASQLVLAQRELELLLVNSQTLKRTRLRGATYRALQSAAQPPPIGRALLGDMRNWARAMGNHAGTLALADPVTMLVALEPRWIATARPFELRFNPLPGVHMKHPRAGELVAVTLDGDAPPRHRVVTAFAEPDGLRHAVVEILRATVRPSR